MANYDIWCGVYWILGAFVFVPALYGILYAIGLRDVRERDARNRDSKKHGAIDVSKIEYRICAFYEDTYLMGDYKGILSHRVKVKTGTWTRAKLDATCLKIEKKLQAQFREVQK